MTEPGKGKVKSVHWLQQDCPSPSRAFANLWSEQSEIILPFFVKSGTLGITKFLASFATSVPFSLLSETTLSCFSILGLCFLFDTFYTLLCQDFRWNWLQTQPIIQCKKTNHVAMCLGSCWWRNLMRLFGHNRRDPTIGGLTSLRFYSVMKDWYGGSTKPSLHFKPCRIRNVAFLRPMCENLAVCKSGLAANILFGVFWVFLKISQITPNLHVVAHSGIKHSKCLYLHSHKYAPLPNSWNYPVTLQTQRMEVFNDA